MLGRLNHPCVVALVGVSTQPLCIVLKLSPLGSLFSILEKEVAKLESEKFQHSGRQSTHDVRKPIFDRDLTYKIVYQVMYSTFGVQILPLGFVKIFEGTHCLNFPQTFVELPSNIS